MTSHSNDDRRSSVPEVDVVAASSSFRLPKNMWPLLPVCVYIVLAALGPSVVDPTVPDIRKTYFGDSTTPAMWTGGLESFFSFAGLFTGGVFGRLSDTQGRWPVLCLSVFLAGFPLVLHYIFLDSNVWPFMLTQSIANAIGATPTGSPAMGFAMITDLYEPFERLVPLSLFGTSYFVGLSGSFLPTLFSLSNLHIAMLGALLGIFIQLFCLFVLKESLPVEKRKRVPIKELFQNPLAPLKFVLKSRYLRAFTALNFCFNFPFFVVGSVNLYYLEDKVHSFGSSDNAVFITSSGVSFIVLSYTAVPLGLRYLSPPTLISIAAFGAIAHNALFLVVWEKWQVFALLGPSSALSLCSVPVITQLVTSSLQPSEQGVVLGTMAAIKGLASALGPILGAGAYSLGTKYLGGLSALPYCISLTVSVIGFLVAVFMVRSVVKEKEIVVSIDDDDRVPIAKHAAADSHETCF